MVTSRASHRTIARAAIWRRILMVLLLAAIVIAPAARAACAIEHVARAATPTATPASAPAGTTSSDDTSEFDDCCAEQTQAFGVSHDAGALTIVVTTSPLPDAPPPAFLALRQPAALATSLTRWRAPSPYEPVSRRVRRLLI